MSVGTLPSLPPGAPTLAKRLHELMMALTQAHEQASNILTEDALQKVVAAPAFADALAALKALPVARQETCDIQGVEHWRDAEGAWRSTALIKPQDKMRNDFVMTVVTAALNINASLARYKSMTLSEAGALREVVAADYGVELGGAKGNMRLTSIDGEWQVEVAVQGVKGIRGENVAIARAALKNWLEAVNADPEVKALIDVAFGTAGSEGGVRVAEVLKLRTLNINHQEWLKAMAAITDGIEVNMTREYVRIRRRNAQGDYDLLPLDLAAV